MAELQEPRLVFGVGCPDCAERRVDLPPPLPEVGDDFDWLARDYDRLRAFMLEELVARFPERRRWTAADLEVVLLEALASVLDRLSDMLDRVAAEAVLETARRPQSVRRLLALIGYDAPELALARGEISAPGGGLPADRRERREALARLLDHHWLREPLAMERARLEGPLALRDQNRMVTVSDHALGLEDHPLVLRARSWTEWGGSWTVLRAAIIAWGDLELDDPVGEGDLPVDVRERVERFHRDRLLPVPAWELSPSPTVRSVLRSYLEAYRMAGQEVVLQDALLVGVVLGITVVVGASYFHSEIRRAVAEALGSGPGGFFEPGRRTFGEDLHASDLIEALTALPGVETVCLTRFKRVGRQQPDRSAEGTLALGELEVTVLDDDREHPERGYLELDLRGGVAG